jgi:hypothetical protein
VTPSFLQGGLDRLFQRPVPADEHAEVLPVAEDGGEGLGEVLDAFLPAQPADVADEGGSVGQRGGDGEGVEVEEVAWAMRILWRCFRGSIRKGWGI